MEDKILSAIKQHQAAAAALAQDYSSIKEIAAALAKTALAGGKILICGNGGSAADSQHIAGELVGRFKKERRAIAAVSLSTDTSVLTCLGNDYGFDRVFERQVEALGRPGDLLIAISTSGSSPNVLKAAVKAREIGMQVVGFFGRNGGAILPHCSLSFLAPGTDTPRVQEMHILAAHIICELVEDSVS
ncbi:MAG: phosphoheptose isomerase [Elusimicrobia bacterium CG_4_10_14_0_2_um_filter_56_8]|nr:MAG: phosphoheptose isomerase [Elusimicrobia bacterium CG1_02_56_21]PJA11676.1 MAG: phosphoheptose isomerase [Elusimicrobia bacterium CG_4_10_14_0_2_um_filter_56_8]